jgi:DNA-binding transcriptional ArsR family regulator
MSERADIRKLVEKGLGSAGRLRLLRVMTSGETPTYTRYGLEKLTGLSPAYVRKHLKVLVDTGWVKELNYASPVYALNLDDLKVKLLVDYFRKIGYL